VLAEGLPLAYFLKFFVKEKSTRGRTSFIATSCPSSKKTRTRCKLKSCPSSCGFPPPVQKIHYIYIFIHYIYICKNIGIYTYLCVYTYIYLQAEERTGGRAGSSRRYDNKRQQEE
jgi:hypothetical protein